MRILVIGRGGREHAIVWKLSQSPKVSKLYCAPGNGGIAQLAECVPITELQFAEIADFAISEQIDLVFVAPDDPLAAGMVDYLEARGVRAYGPRQNAAIIEGSKTFMKNLLKKYNIPTAAYETFDNYEAALAYLHKQSAPIVIKADGLAAGKGVIVAQTLDEAELALKDIMLDKVFGTSGSQVVIEEFMQGQEMSLLAFVDGETVRMMAPSQDHKPAFDGDKGPNTGGMGTYSPVPHIPQAVVDEAIETIVVPTAKAMVAEGRPFRGVLYAGLMIGPDHKPRTVEFNARFGDPETQVLLPRLQTDLLDIVLATLDGTLAELPIAWSSDAAVCVIVAAEGYPGSYPKGRPITGLDRIDGALVFHAGTALKDGQLVTNGGRLLGVTALGADIREARERAYEQIQHIELDGMHYRTDIAMKAIQPQ
jgi:phosphoribosylamine---glycine ligase